jgi:hypothetical protein
VKKPGRRKDEEKRMRKGPTYFLAAAGVSLALAFPGVALGTGTQGIQAGFSPKANGNVVFGQSIALDDKKFSKKGTLRTRVFLSDVMPPVPAVSHVDIDFAAEGRITTKGIPTCDSADIEGLTNADAIAACKKAQLGGGTASAFGIAQPGPLAAFNGPKQGGNPTILLHSNVVIPITLTGVITDSPAGPQYGNRLSVQVQPTVPAGIAITNFDTTVSKVIKPTKKKRKRKKRTLSYVSARCTDGTAQFQGTFDYSNFPTQTVQTTQPCTVK